MAWPPETTSYCSWKEVYVTSEKGRKEVQFYLKRRDGSADLAVIGREKNSRRMSYRYALKMNRSVLYKLSTRGDVVDWLNSIVSGVFPLEDNISATPANTQISEGLKICTSKDSRYVEIVHQSKSWSWMGSPWTCRKRRKHYPSFCRNGVRVSVNDFVYVLAEQNKRLIAYVEDMYEEYKGNKMVVVRWFHKTDEVGIDLPHNDNDKEIFFSLCIQEINIECIDGLATVLSVHHYEKFLKEFLHGQPIVFFCRKLYEDDDALKPYDITQLKGYWGQEIFRYLNVDISKSNEEIGSELGVGALEGNYGGFRLRKRRRSSPIENLDTPLTIDQKLDHKGNSESVNFDDLPDLTTQEEAKSGSCEFIKKGLFVEVLSQDSGIRGCWFRALIIKKHKDKVKVQYQDIQDADDESKKLEEWILTSRVASTDQFGLRIPNRKIIRPPLESCRVNTQCNDVIGMLVDVWLFDGWWEGIVVQKVSDERFKVYLSGERKMSFVHCNDLRQSQEWLGDKWVHMKSRVDLVTSIESSVEKENIEVKVNKKSTQVGVGINEIELKGEAELNGKTDLRSVPDLLKDVLVSNLKWKTSRKRKRSSNCYTQKLGLSNCFPKNHGRKRSVASDSFKVDCENCKFMGDSLFGSSVPPPLTGLVLSR